MLKKIKEKFQDKFSRIWLLLLGAAVLILIYQHFQKPPSLADVLSSGKITTFNQLPLYIATMLAFSLLALSLAKGYEIVKRKNDLTEAVLSSKNISTVEVLEKSQLKKELESLQETNQRLLSENIVRKNEYQESCSQLEKLKFAEQMLRRSNLYLTKECDRLKSENEKLTLRFNSFKVDLDEPLINLNKKEKIRAKTKGQSRAKSKAKIKK